MPKQTPTNNTPIEHVISTTTKEYQKCLDHLNETMEINALIKASYDHSQYNQGFSFGYSKGYSTGYADGYTKAQEDYYRTNH